MDDNLFEKLKKRADLSGSTVSWLVENVVRVMLDRRSPRIEARDAFELVTYGAGGRFSKFDIDKTAGLIAAEDFER